MQVTLLVLEIRRRVRILSVRVNIFRRVLRRGTLVLVVILLTAMWRLRCLTAPTSAIELVTNIAFCRGRSH